MCAEVPFISHLFSGSHAHSCPVGSARSAGSSGGVCPPLLDNSTSLLKETASPWSEETPALSFHPVEVSETNDQGLNFYKLNGFVSWRTSSISIRTPILQTGKLRPREIKQTAQSPTASELKTGARTGCLGPRPLFCSVLFSS